MAAFNSEVDEDQRAWLAEMPELYKRSPAHQALGLSLVSVTLGEVELQLRAPESFNNLGGWIHGGILATAIDSALLQAIRSSTSRDDHLVTQEFKINFLRPAQGVVRVVGRALHVGGGSGVASALATGGDGRAVASAMGTIHIRRGGR